MIARPEFPLITPDLPRRRFLQGLAGGGVLLGLPPWTQSAWAQTAIGSATGPAQVLSGTEFDLTIAETPVNFTGVPRMATTIKWRWLSYRCAAYSAGSETQCRALIGLPS